MFRKMQQSLLMTVAAAPLVLLFGCTTSGPTAAGLAASGTTFPVSVHAANGTVRIAAKPKAIVSLSPTATEMLYAMGAGSQVKAVDQNSDYPHGVPTTSLDGNNPNTEAIASYNPDLVVISQDDSGLSNKLKALGITVLSDPAAVNLNQEYQQFEQLGEATGHAAQARAQVATITARIAQIVQSAPKATHSKSYYYELDQTFFSETSSTFIGQVLGLLGLKSIADTATGAAASGGYPQLSGEFILKLNPDYILLADTICCSQSPATVATRPGWSTLAAVKDSRVLGLSDDIASRWGPRIVDLLQMVSDELKLHPSGTSS
jgi:iron complex transport system substrate-binding protein